MSHEMGLLEVLKASVESHGGVYGPRYAAAAVLTDGTILPRVVFFSDMWLDVTAEYLRKWSDDAAKFKRVVSRVAKRNYIEAKYVARAEPSLFATPSSIFRLLEDPIERMEYASFSLEMGNGVILYFDIDDVEAFSGPPEFIELPEQYSFSDVRKVRRHSDTPAGVSVNYYGKEPVFFCCLSSNQGTR